MPRITHEAVLDIARTLPPESLTLTAISDRLGVTQPALYRYFPDRAAVLEALAREAAARLVPPDADLPWDEWLLQAAHAERELWRTHANLYEAANYRAISRPAAHMIRVGLEVLTAAGFTPLDALCGLSAVTELAHAVGIVESRTDVLLEADALADLEDSLSAIDEPITPDLMFDRVVDITIDGLRPLLRTNRWRKRG